MFRWINGPGSVFRDPLPGSTNYLNAYDAGGSLIRLRRGRDTEDEEAGNGKDEEGLSAIPGEEGAKDDSKNYIDGKAIPRETVDDLMPFPLNKEFRSQPVLSEALKDEIFRRVTVERKSVKVVSAEMGVEMSRVGAVVRLKSVEQEWIRAGKPLASPYARAVMDMLPQTPFRTGETPIPHESINDLPVHRDTLRQLFHPTSESRVFTRVDAGKVFSHTLLPADERIPHPELVQLAKSTQNQEIRQAMIIEQGEKYRMAEARAKEKEARRLASIQTIHSGRWDFRFQNVSVDSVGLDGRDTRGVGARYGVPRQDRKKGQIKIPRSVE
ncbi:hypothetical protein MMC30_004794 [Trapelia coarctata]|nr:hypothetical protein [Trapelia coarctata]